VGQVYVEQAETAIDATKIKTATDFFIIVCVNKTMQK
jgi:hypothetical protein